MKRGRVYTMFGKGDTQTHTAATTLPVLVHALRSDRAWELVQKIWQANHRSLVVDAANHKELLHFVFSNPTCVSWLQRDQGRTDVFELILVWGDGATGITEVYTIEAAKAAPAGEDARACSLLAGILASPATVPAAHH